MDIRLRVFAPIKCPPSLTLSLEESYFESSSGIMIFPFYFIFVFSQEIVTTSFSNDESAVNGAGKLDFTTPNQLDSSSPVSGDDPSVAIQGATNSFDNAAISQGSNLWPPNNQFDVLSDNSVDGEDERLGLLFDGNGGGEGGTDISIPSVPFNPVQLFNGVPEYIDNIRQWFRAPKEPNCRDGKYAFCCQKPAPKRKRGSDPGRPPNGKPQEYSQRRAACTTCRCFLPSARFLFFQSLTPLRMSKKLIKFSGSPNNPVCKFPENIFCCFCRDQVCDGFTFENAEQTSPPPLPPLYLTFTR